MATTTVCCSMQLGEYNSMIEYKKRIGHTGSISNLIKTLLKMAMESAQPDAARGKESCRK